MSKLYFIENTGYKACQDLLFSLGGSWSDGRVYKYPDASFYVLKRERLFYGYAGERIESYRSDPEYEELFLTDEQHLICLIREELSDV